ncbi:acyltransferase family protein [Streptococcus suis]|uniref:Acyltransferase family protein n=1 Tax=Streptococcus suis TaxID=1307 RepID=A0A0F6UYJ6_STRSU|nr:acyltransferase family protein [Streptococcus suis]AKE79387.1 nodulation acetyltransferase protein [Streptococcus suis]AKE79584.1 nodulation acetyltransferase protein [Streptococcus suis]AKE80283.1 nodulation acetyltransferase protein [Streptococcus suis]MDG4515444.1 acyltransferase family protein [Streptococcus suis]NQH65662.1 acyltransferase [Streptococcus suis]
MAKQKSNRNSTIDIIRGIAMLMVVLGHTMTGCTMDAENSFLFNVIWTLQMPLFILISGYVTKYSRTITSGKAYGKFVCKKTFAYLFPWAVWTFAVRGLIFEQTLYLNVKYILFLMDSGYWFLFTLWTIVMIYGFAQFISELVCANKSKFKKLLVHTIVYVLGMVILASIGLVMGLSFLCIKLTLYYMPFYFAGFLFGQFDTKLFEYKHGNTIKEIAVAVCFVGWIALMVRFNFYSIGDEISEIILRALASMMGCIAVCGFISKSVENKSELEKVRGGIASQYRRTLSGDISDSLSASIDGEVRPNAEIRRTSGEHVNSIELHSDHEHSVWCNEVDQSKSGVRYGSVWKNSLSWIGQHSLEIYLLHGFTLNLLQNQVKPIFLTSVGIVLTLVNYFVTVVLTCGIIALIGENRCLTFALLGNKK